MWQRQVSASVLLLMVLAHHALMTIELRMIEDDDSGSTVCPYNCGDGDDTQKKDAPEKRQRSPRRDDVDEPVEVQEDETCLDEAFPVIALLIFVPRPLPGVAVLPIRLRRSAVQAVLSGRQQ